MQYRILGSTGLRVSEIGLGSEVLVGQSEAEAMKLIEAALAAVLVGGIMLSSNPAYDMLPPSEDVDSLFSADTFASSALANIDPARSAR